MADQVVEGLKKAKSSLKQERKPVSQVVAAQKATKQINEFVKAALAEENRWVLHPDEQTSIVETLQSINKLYQELYDKCRTPYHFEKNAAKYITMKQEISHQVSCIHLSLDQGSTSPNQEDLTRDRRLNSRGRKFKKSSTALSRKASGAGFRSRSKLPKRIKGR